MSYENLSNEEWVNAINDDVTMLSERAKFEGMATFLNQYDRLIHTMDAVDVEYLCELTTFDNHFTVCIDDGTWVTLMEIATSEDGTKLYAILDEETGLTNPHAVCIWLMYDGFPVFLGEDIENYDITPLEQFSKEIFVEYGLEEYYNKVTGSTETETE